MPSLFSNFCILIVLLFSSLGGATSNKNRLIARLDSSDNNGRSLLISDPLTAAIFTLVVTTGKEYATSSDCKWTACEKININFVNHFCSVNMEHNNQNCYSKMLDTPDDVISGNSKGKGGSFYGHTYTEGVLRYSVDINGYIYYIDSYWCIDCNTCTNCGVVSDVGDIYEDKIGFGLAVLPTYGLDVEESKTCFWKYYQKHFGDYTIDLSAGDCDNSDYYRSIDIFEAGGNNIGGRYELTYDNGDVGLKIEALMTEDSTKLITIDVYPLNGQESDTCSA